MHGVWRVSVHPTPLPRSTPPHPILQDMDDGASEIDPDEAFSDRPAFYLTQLSRQPGQGLGMGLGFEGDSVIVTSVDPDSPADDANIMEGAFPTASPTPCSSSGSMSRAPPLALPAHSPILRLPMFVFPPPIVGLYIRARSVLKPGHPDFHILAISRL